ncbi:MAG: hypothetical protein ILP17_02605 [Lachnospiraceae bacterium]|nr:hypothetical protein [Lachnospiraceae bacterium]
MKDRYLYIIASVVCLIILLIPLPADSLFLRMHLKEASAGDYRLYYTTDGSMAFNGEQFIDGMLNDKGDIVSFEMEPELEGRITGLRFDLPPAEGLVTMDSVSVSSGGAVKSRWSVSDIFASGNLVMVNGAQVQSVPSRELTYISTTENDPYVVFAPNVVSELTGRFSHKWGTKIVIVLLIGAAMVFHRKNLFDTKDR